MLVQRLTDAADLRCGDPQPQALNQLIDLGQRTPTAFMCGEADYHGCHRHRLIAAALIEQGVQVWHIMADGSCERGEIEPQQMRMF